MKANGTGDRYGDPFPARLRELLKRRGATQQELAGAIGVKRQTVSAYADGSADPTLPRLAAMAEFFRVSIDYLVGKDECESPDNERMRLLLGLSEGALTLLRERRAALGGGDAALMTVNALFEAEAGRGILAAMAAYLWTDFSRGTLGDGTPFCTAQFMTPNGPLVIEAADFSEALPLTVTRLMRELRNELAGT